MFVLMIGRSPESATGPSMTKVGIPCTPVSLLSPDFSSRCSNGRAQKDIVSKSALKLDSSLSDEANQLKILSLGLQRGICLR